MRKGAETEWTFFDIAVLEVLIACFTYWTTAWGLAEERGVLVSIADFTLKLRR
jgi:hypothetical protein